MANTVLVGLQWGDEGKGKIIDVLTEQAEVVVRFQGGNNAGHTVEIGSEKYALHLIPSGILHPGTLCIIGNGLVVNPLGLHQELTDLAARGIATAGRLFISSRAHLVFSFHQVMDGVNESRLGEGKIGTTRRGIGPAYSDKINRVGIRAGELRDPARLEALFRKQAAAYQERFRRAGVTDYDIDAEWAALQPVAAALAPLVRDTTLLLHQAIRENRRILFEGAQGTWLDVDFGTYPFVTSSNTTAGGACTGTGVPPNQIHRSIGVAKAYTTRVGSGPFMTELNDATGERLRATGREFGTTTGRPRRCGWFDAVATRYAVMLNGTTGLAVTKLDVLDGLPALQICVAYEVDGVRHTELPDDPAVVERARPVYETLPGWSAPTAPARKWTDLPANAQAYLRRLSELVGAPIDIVSVGPGRDQTFFA
ncbi:MAG: adenylosuccinate synthase [Lentisphaeria bacterium]|jgi:adenylosuccinate synthase